MSLTVTIDLEDHRSDPSRPIRYDRLMYERVLPMLDRLGARATVFVVGTVAQRTPALVADIAAAGHEIGLHGWDHESIESVGRTEFAELVERGRDTVGAITGLAPVGFRAPSFSLTAATPYAPDVLREAGFEYSSSVLPAPNPIHGLAGAPTSPFRWDCGLVELPTPLVHLGPLRVPLGGTYLRVLPTSVIRRALRPTGLDWVYLHAYDVDVHERFWWEPVAGVMAPLLWVGRRGVETSLLSLVGSRAADPLADRVRRLDPDTLAEFSLPSQALGGR